VNRRAVTIVSVLALVAAGGTAWWATHRGRESTENAQVEAEVVPVPTRGAGLVTKVLFEENQAVKAGQVLATLDDEAPRAKLAQAEANVLAAEAAADAADADAKVAESNAVGNKSIAEAGLKTASAGAYTASDQIKEAEAAVSAAAAAKKQAELDRDRNKSLLEKGVIAGAVFDQSETAVVVASSNLEVAKARVSSLKANASQASGKVAEASAKVQQSNNVETIVLLAHAKAKAAHAQVATAKALRELAKLDVSYTQILAPSDGVASKKTIVVGQNLAAGQTIVQLVTSSVWVTANFKETQIGRMHSGQAAEVEIDAFPGLALHGHVESVSGATGSRFALLPPDNASGNFTKVVQRVPVRVRVDALPTGIVLRPGMSVELTVDTRG
jgi:membrane fusion protein (multidrug efflux system)